jgi:hypothetical protein
MKREFTLLNWINPWWSMDVQLFSPHSRTECERRLIANIDGDTLQWVRHSPGLQVARHRWHANNWQTVASVGLQAVGAGTSVSITLSMASALRVFTTMWYAVVALGTVLGLAAALSLGRPRDVSAILLEGMLVAILMIAMSVVGGYLARDDKQYLIDVIQGILDLRPV